MALHAAKSQGTQPPPTSSLSATGHPLPRRSSPANSLTLNHHKAARNASFGASLGSSPAKNSISNITDSPRRNSSGESHQTGQSDPKKWFDQSNENPIATFDNGTMDVDPPFFQKETDSSNEDKHCTHQNPPQEPRLTTHQSSSADDYRSVIDDLTVEIQKLKEELKKHNSQKGPDMLRKDQLFEIKYHGLPKRKRRELESTLRDFAASVQDSPDVSLSRRQKSLRQSNRDHMYSGSGSASKHAWSSSGSNIRPVDSAYASMSSGANSSGLSLGGPTANSRAKNDQKVQSYLRDIPEGLYPRNMIMTEREKKKLVVRRLEQLFTGKIGGRRARQAKQSHNTPATGASAVDPELRPRFLKDQQPAVTSGPEPSREAKILPREQQSANSEKKSRSRDNISASNSHDDRTESGGNGNSSRSGTNTSPTEPPAPDQLPTRVGDLDPDRIQVPSENMDYIRHLGLVPPELLKEPPKEVQSDADGWVYLNLLCNLAQVHIVNVTPSFIRAAVSEMSTKFQLSPDGRKIRWRGGSEGTYFSSDSSNESSQTTPDIAELDSSNADGHRKRQKTGNLSGYECNSGGSSKTRSKSGPQVSVSSDNFHYKPLFARNSSPTGGETSLDDTLSSFGPIQDSNVDESRWELSGSGTSNRRKRRHDGAIIYYGGAPFCTDLSGDSGGISPTAYMLSNGQDNHDHQTLFDRPVPFRSASGSSLSYRPLSDRKPSDDSDLKMDVDSTENVPDLVTDLNSAPGSPDPEFPWSSGQQYIEMLLLEPCGLGGVMPDDHFMVVVTTKRSTDDIASKSGPALRGKSEEATDLIINQLASISTSSPGPVASAKRVSHPVEIEYVSGRIKRLAPVSLPPPVIFLPPFSSDSSSYYNNEFGSEDDGDARDPSEELMSRKANPHQSDDYPDGVDLSSGDEDGEEPDEDSDGLGMYGRMDTDDIPGGNHSIDDGDKRPSIGSAEAAIGSVRRRSNSASAGHRFRPAASSVATAGEVGSICSSMNEKS
ncbi:hypothetical protein QQS21_006721 [Conoideocrella luteorostrata]|uniref:Frequency clock protein n=1 Tax=Conoideocrella luteorostrata TaxID=1105319 RepID=A0AAJ0CMW0_9HYPO|nr:hypothetical protein QQS21_006721 [Conoideocrella luteorostrata]